jgi:uncharacterized protein (DUF2252 family)
MTEAEGKATPKFHNSAERYAIGKALRDQVPRLDQAVWQPASDRRDPIEILADSSRGRVPELIPIRYGRMLANPFAFLRGSAAVMAYDLAQTPSSAIQVQACGDCHLANFGLFATPERNLVFDLNDFDETLPAPWEWDLKRLAASFAVCGRQNGIPDKSCESIATSLVSSYRMHISDYASMRVLDVWYARLDDRTLIERAPTEAVRRRREQIAAKARASVSEYLFPKLTKVVDGSYRIADKPPLIYHLPERDDLEERVKRLFASYHKSLPAHLRKLFDHYHFVDLAFKVVGVGSVGTRCYVVLYLAEGKDALLLQVKEANASVLEPYTAKSEFAHHGQRIVVGQRLMQSASDMFLGWMTGLDRRHYYVRQLRDMKFSVPLDNLRATDLSRYAELCGWILARAHAKGGDAAMISGYLGKSDTFDKAVARFSLAYADQTEQDYQALVKAVKSGRLKASYESL